MLNDRTKRGLYLLATTSMISLSLSAAPVTVDFDLSQPVLKLAQADSCCFTAETGVLMADGSQRPIGEVRVGDLVMGRNGRANRVTGIERPVLGARLLYALNGGSHFVTAEHPFATPVGWKAIDPAATAAENPDLKVARLLVGDCLMMLRHGDATAGNLALAAAAPVPLVVLSLDARPAEPETPLYNLLLDGDHAYFANGLLVHNKGGGDGGGGDGGGEGGGEGGSDGGGESGGDGGGESGESGEGGGESGESGHGGETGEAGSADGSADGSAGPSAEASGQASAAPSADASADPSAAASASAQAEAAESGEAGESGESGESGPSGPSGQGADVDDDRG